MAAGLLVVLVDVSYEGWDLAPNVVGYLAVAWGTGRLIALHWAGRWAFACALLLTPLGFALWWPTVPPAVADPLRVVEGVLLVALSWALCKAMADVGGALDRSGLRRAAVWCWWLLAAGLGPATAASAVYGPWTDEASAVAGPRGLLLLGLVLYVIASVVFLVSLLLRTGRVLGSWTGPSSGHGPEGADPQSAGAPNGRR